MFQYMGATVSGEIAAPPATLWPIITDVTRHPELAGSGEVSNTQLSTDGPIGLGSRFQSNQQLRGVGPRYVTVSHVVVFDPPHRFAWQIGLPGTPPFGQVWQFELTPRGSNTLVENGVALPYVVPGLPPFSLLKALVAEQEVNTMLPTLDNLARIAGAGTPLNVEKRLAPPASAAALLPSPYLQGALWFVGTALLGAMAVRRSMGLDNGNGTPSPETAAEAATADAPAPPTEAAPPVASAARDAE